jgi:cytochrome P450
MSRPVDRRDMLGRFLEAKHPSGNPLSMDEVMEQAMTVVSAGSDSTAIALCGILSFIMKTPGVCAKVVDEIETFATKGEISDPITYTESLKLTYFCACVKEGLRLHSPVGYLLPRRVPEQGTTIAGRYFPPGVSHLLHSDRQSIVGINPWTIHREETIFGPEPEEFKPERWLESAERSRFMENYNLTFGQGGRTCIGKVFYLILTYEEHRFDGDSQGIADDSSAF